MGFEGIEITKVEGLYIASSFGIKGVEITKTPRRYIAPAFGFKGFEFNVVDYYKIRVKKIVKY